MLAQILLAISYDALPVSRKDIGCVAFDGTLKNYPHRVGKFEYRITFPPVLADVAFLGFQLTQLIKAIPLYLTTR
jgi:hypothetical protein